MADEQLKPAPDAGKIPTPIMPSEPPKEVKEMTFSIDPTVLGQSSDSTIKVDGKEIKTELAEVKKDADKKEVESVLKAPKEEIAKADIKVPDDKPKEELKKEVKEPVSVLKPPTEVKKDDSKKDEPIKSDKKPDIITPVKPEGHDAFDYSSFTPQEQITLKNMSRQSREYTANLIRDNKQLTTLKDSTYLQHEQGYTLSPEYQEIQQRNYFAQTEAKCWERALLNIKAGKKFQNVVGFDQKTGQPIMSQEQDPSDQDEIRISNNLTLCSQYIGQYNNALQTYPQRFRQQVQSDLQAIEQTQKERFAWVADPKLLEYSINVDGTDRKVKDIKADFKNILPIYRQNDILADVASNLFVAMIIQGVELKEARNGQQIAEIKKQEATRAEPSSDNVDSQVKKTEINGKPIPSMFSLEGAPFERR
jgi:hypothetical protein